jgi:two-component system OmpR family sensor kinase
MKNLSVTTFIHILFTQAIIILLITFFVFISWDKERRKLEEISHYKLIADAFLSNVQLNPTAEKLETFYENFSVKPIDVEKTQDKIKKDGKTIFEGKSIYGKVRVFEIDGEHVIYVQRLGYNLMLSDDRPQNYNFEIAISVGIVLILSLLLLYLAILKKLYPLKRLHKEIEEFATGNMDIKITYQNDDEIGKIAKNFDDAILHIKELISSKNLFMRNMMHELKTPITKGRIVVESIDDEMVKGILVRAFDRMNELIKELAQVERVTTRNFVPMKEPTTLYKVIEESQHMLISDKQKITIEIKNITFQTDYRLLALAIKNLLDNGIKYSSDHKVKLVAKDWKLIKIISKGDGLQHPISYYTEPFSQEEKRSEGFGLGLYIVHSILEKLNYTLGYRYEDGQNIFAIISKNKKPIGIR